jgi:hypothetical protein
MRIGSRTASLVLLLGLVAAGCSRRNLEVGAGNGAGKLGIDGGGGGGSSGGSGGSGGLTDGGPADPNDGGPPLDAVGVPPPFDAGDSDCVTTTIALPWMKPSSALTRLDVAATADAVAVMNRQPMTLDVRTYARDGAIIAGYQFAADAQFLPGRDGRFLLIARGVTGDFVATALDPDLVGGTRLYTAAASATERMLGAITLATTTIVITDEHFVNMGTGRAVPWSAAFEDDAEGVAFQAVRLYGMAAQADRVLIAWGSNDVLRRAVLDASGTLVVRADDRNFLGYLGSETTTAIPWDTGLLMFDGNGVRLTQIAFDLTFKVLGTNTQLRTFSRTAPRVAAIALLGRPVAFWLTVFPETDNTQGVTTHQLYGCDIDLAAPATCLGTSLIAATGLGGYGIAQEPLAAAAIPGSASVAIAHTDVAGRSWLRIADLACANRRDGP